MSEQGAGGLSNLRQRIDALDRQLLDLLNQRARIAEEVGTPVYVYSTNTFRRHAQVFREGLKHVGRIHLAYAIKANPNLAVLRVLAEEGYGADVVSGGEMARALAAGMPASEIVFSGVGKTRAELARVNKAVAEGVKQIADAEEEARRAGVPAGWLR